MRTPLLALALACLAGAAQAHVPFLKPNQFNVLHPRLHVVEHGDDAEGRVRDHDRPEAQVDAEDSACHLDAVIRLLRRAVPARLREFPYS